MNAYARFTSGVSYRHARHEAVRRAAWGLAQTALMLGFLVFGPAASAAGSRLLGAGGITNVSGAAGGGITTWALLSGYASDTENSVNAAVSHVGLPDFSLDTVAAGFNWHNRVDLTLAENRLHVDALDTDIERQAVGVKVRLLGEAIYDRYGQTSAGLIYGHNSDMRIPRALGATHAGGVDAYLAVSKIVLGGLFGRNLIFNASVRGTRANQIGLLGYGSRSDDDWAIRGSGSAGVFLTPQVILGGEYQQKSNRLAAVDEDDWYDVFVVYVLNKSLALSAAWVNLGDVAGFSGQRGYFISLQTGFGS